MTEVVRGINWTLWIALAGFLLGLYNTFAEPWFNRVQFACDVKSVVTGESVAEGNESVIMLLTLTVANKGKELLVPEVFECALRNGKTWMSLEKQLIPGQAAFLSSTHEIKLADPLSNDLQRFSGVIGPGNPLRGSLLFATRDVTLSALRELLRHSKRSIRLTCADIYGRKHVYFPLIDLSSNNGKVYPKHGVEFSNKTTSTLAAGQANRLMNDSEEGM